jgi:hypothetical protein
MKTIRQTMKATEQIISDNCRNTHGEEKAVDIALAELRKEALACMKGWPSGQESEFHLSLDVIVKEKFHKPKSQKLICQNCGEGREWLTLGRIAFHEENACEECGGAVTRDNYCYVSRQPEPK